MRTFDGLDLKVRTHGPDGAELTVVLAHCWTMDQDVWRYQVRDLQHRFGHAIRIVTYDQRGHGESAPAPEAACTIRACGTDLGTVIDEYAATGPLVLVGHSLGGMSILDLAGQRPELFERVVGTVLISTSSGSLDTVTLGLPEMRRSVRDRIPFLLAVRARMRTRSAGRRAPTIETAVAKRFLFGRPFRVRDLHLAVDGMLACPPQTFSGFFRDLMTYDGVPGVKVVGQAPVRVLVGSHDLLTPIDHARAIAAELPRATLTIAPGAGHMLPLERDELVSETLADQVANGLAAQAAARERASATR